MVLEMEVLKLKREMSPRCVASQTLETHKKLLWAVRHSSDLQRGGCGWNHVKLLRRLQMDAKLQAVRIQHIQKHKASLSAGMPLRHSYEAGHTV